MKDASIESLEPSVKHSKSVYASNSIFQFTVTFMSTAQTVFLFFYYEAVLGLNYYLIFAAMVIFTVWDAINDPLIGFLTDRNFKWTRRWGRRFPWIVIGIAPWCLSLYLIFSAPNIDARVNPWPVFWWLVLSLVLLDTFGTLVGVNITALRPDKFRSEDERRVLSGYFGLFDMIALSMGMLIPPLFLGLGTGRESYAIMGGMVAFIALISAVLCLPGSREEKLVIDRYYSTEYERMSFLKGLKEAIFNKPFVVFMIALTAFNIATTIMTSNVVYLTTFVLRASPDTITLIFAIFLTGALISIPFWLWYLKKIKNNKKVLTVGGFVMCAALVPMTFFQTLIDLLIIVFILGVSMGSMWIYFYTVILANVADDYVVKTKKNQKAILIGVTFLVSRLGATMDELLISLVHDLTGFIPGYDTYEALAAVVANMEPVLWGIRFLTGVIPALILLIGTLIFWKFYPLTQDLVIKNKAELEKLGF